MGTFLPKECIRAPNFLKNVFHPPFPELKFPPQNFSNKTSLGERGSTYSPRFWEAGNFPRGGGISPPLKGISLGKGGKFPPRGGKFLPRGGNPLGKKGPNWGGFPRKKGPGALFGGLKKKKFFFLERNAILKHRGGKNPFFMRNF